MRKSKFHIGLRTLKTALAIMVALMIVDFYGASTSKVIFALIGAASAMDATFKSSLKACLTQICGVFFGALFGVLMLYVPIDEYVAVGIGFLLITSLYRMFHLTLSPVLPCIIVATILTNPDIVPLQYAGARLWDTLIGLTVGFVINMLFFPYDTSRQIRSAVEGLDRDILAFLAALFDGSGQVPDPSKLLAQTSAVEKQLALMEDQKWIHHRKRQKNTLSRLSRCEEKARALITELEALTMMETPGHLTPLNRERLENYGVLIQDKQAAESGNISDIVTNYHVTQILALRRELRELLDQQG